MKSWLKFGAIAVMVAIGFLLLVMAGYLAGWKTGSAAKLPPGSQDAEASKLNFQASQNESANNTRKPQPTESASLEDTLSKSWHSLRFAPDTELAAARLWELLSGLDQAELARAFSLACDLPGGETRRNAVWMVLRQWAEIDSEGAIAACAREFKGWDRLNWMVDLLGMISPKDPLLGYRAYQQHLAELDAPSHDSAVFPLAQIFRNWAEKDFNGAWAEFARLNPREQQYALRGMSGLLHVQSAAGEELLRRLNDVADPDLLEMARVEVARTFGRKSDINSAEAWLESQALPADSRVKLENTIAESWALEDPRGAAEWLNERASLAEAGERLKTVIGRWADWEPVECAQWLNHQLEQGRNMDAAIDVFARQIASKEPATALSWAAHITSSDQRRRTSEFLAESFRRQLISDPEELIRNSALSEADKTAALRKVTR